MTQLPARPSPAIAVHQLSLYNAGRMSTAELMATFSARQIQLERLIADIAAEGPKRRPQHHLIVGQRGMGKTMLLARIAAQLRVDVDLAARFIPLVFAEEQYAVDRLSKFWLNCLDSLADARELAGDHDSVTEIDDTVIRLTVEAKGLPKDDPPFADDVYQAFIAVAKKSGQRPVLLVDNLQIVFERLDPRQQHNLRELLMRPGSPILVGASPSPPPESQDYGAAFYDHFKTHYLRPLDEEEMRSLLLHLATAAGRDDVRERVLSNPARLTVLRQLTGGNPRTTLILFLLYAEDFAPSVFGDLEGLLDRVTPLYKARFEELTPQQQVIASAIANHWDPVTAPALAALTGLPASTVGSQLDRLERTGVVERTELFDDTRTGYQLAERFFNIWFLMRSASRRQRREVEFLTKFLESFYEPTDRTRLARHVMSEEHFSPDRYVLTRAVAASLTDAETAEELNRHAELTALREEAREARERLREVMDFDRLPPATLKFDEVRKKLMSLVPANAAMTPEDFAKAVLGDRTMFSNGVRERLAARGDKLTQSELASVLETLQKSRAADASVHSEQAVSWFSERLASGQIRDSQDADDWSRAFLQAPDLQCIDMMLRFMPYGIGPSLRPTSIKRIESALQPLSDSPAYSWHRWGIFLDKTGRDDEAEQAHREAATREPSYRKAIEADSTRFWPWFDLGKLLHSDRGRAAEAERAYREAINRDPGNVWPWKQLGDLYMDVLRRPVDAAAAYDSGYRLAPSNAVIASDQLFLHRDFLGEGVQARGRQAELAALLKHSATDVRSLHQALFASYESNWGSAQSELAEALAIRPGSFSPEWVAWIRASAVLLHLNYGVELVNLLDSRGDSARLRPWVDALRALNIGDRRALLNIAPEVRATAEILYDEIELRLKNLPDKTRRRAAVVLKRKSKRRVKR